MSRIVHLGDVCHVAVNIVRGLISENHRAVVLISSKVDAYESACYIKINPLHNFGFLKYIYTLFFVIKNWNSIFHCHGMAAIFPYILNFPYVTHVHGSDLREINKHKNLISWAYIKILKKSTAVIVSTPDLIKNYKELGFNLKNLYFIPNSIEIDHLQVLKPEVDYRKIRLFCPSSNHPIKCKNKLLVAFVLLYKKYGNRITLTLINHPSTDKLIDGAYLEERIRKNIFILPFMKHVDLLERYEDYDIVLDQFGYIKSHGVIAYEACAAGLPVISTIGEKVFSCSGIYPGNRPDIIFSSVSKLIDNQLINEAGLKCHTWVSTNLNNSTIAGRFYSLYNSCFKKRELRRRWI